MVIDQGSVYIESVNKLHFYNTTDFTQAKSSHYTVVQPTQYMERHLFIQYFLHEMLVALVCLGVTGEKIRNSLIFIDSLTAEYLLDI